MSDQNQQNNNQNEDEQKQAIPNLAEGESLLGRTGGVYEAPNNTADATTGKGPDNGIGTENMDNIDSAFVNNPLDNSTSDGSNDSPIPDDITKSNG